MRVRDTSKHFIDQCVCDPVAWAEWNRTLEEIRKLHGGTMPID